MNLLLYPMSYDEATKRLLKYLELREKLELTVLWPILTSMRFLICNNFQKYNPILFPIGTFKYMK